MLPFLKPKYQTGLIVEQRKPDGSTPESHSEGNDNEGLRAASADLIRAVHAKDEASVSAALRAAFEILDSEPHVEGEHIEDEGDSE